MGILGTGIEEGLLLKPIKYQWAMDLYDQAVANTWFPNEIQLGEDIADFKKMSADEQHAITYLMSFFNPNELLVNKALAFGVYPYVGAAEAHLYLAKQMWEEANHCMSFEYVLETFPVDREKAYATHVDEPSMAAKEAFQVKYIKRMTESTVDITTTEGKQDFVRNLVAYNVILEGIWFYSGFMVALSFRQRNLLRNFGSLMDWVLRDECITGDTEVLTGRGWIRADQVTSTTKLAQYDKYTGEVSFTEPKQLSRSEVNEVYTLSNKEGHVSQAVSGNHRVYGTKGGDHWESLAKDIKKSDMKRVDFVHGGLKTSGRTEMTAKERLLVAIQADGHIPDPLLRNGKFTGKRDAVFTLSKQRKIDRLEALAEKAGVELVRLKGPRGSTKLKLRIPSDWSYTKELSDIVDLTEVNYLWCEDFIEELAHWDGHFVKENESRITYGSVRPSNAEFVQAVAALCGYRTHYGVRHDDRKDSYQPIHRVQINRDKNTTGGQCVNIAKSDVAQTVYGIEVPTGYIITRHNGAVQVTGNSLHLKFGINLILTVLEENEDLQTAEFAEEIRQMILDAVELEVAYNEGMFPNGILGLNAAYINQYVKYMADRRLEELGFESHYNVTNPAKWMATASDTLELVNFFESTNTSYEANASATVRDKE